MNETNLQPIRHVWVEQVPVRTFECDFQRNWKPSSLMQITNEIAGQHAEHLGVGFEALLQQDMAWVLARVRFHYHSLPQVGAQVTVRTWPKGIQQKLFFIRDFQIESPAGERLVTATTAWLLVNPHTRRMVMPAKLQASLPENSGLSAVDGALEKIVVPDAVEEKHLVEARYSAVDMVGHANSARYMEWITDCFAPQDYASRQLDWIQINYNSEVRPGEKVSVGTAPDPTDAHTFLIQGQNLNTGARAFEAALRWKN